MGGRETNEGTDFQARVAAFIAAHVLARNKLPAWGHHVVIPTAISLEQGTAGDDIRVETTRKTILEIQAKHGLNADTRLKETVERIASLLDDSEFAVIAVDIETSSKTIRVVLRDILDRWREGLDPEVPSVLSDKIDLLIAGSQASIRSRIAVASLDVDDDSSTGSRCAVEILRRILVDQSQAESAWATLVKDHQHSGKRGARRDADFYRKVLSCDNIEVRTESAIAISQDSPFGSGNQASSGGNVPPLLEAAVSLVRSHEPRAALALLHQIPDNDEPKHLLARGAALFDLGQLENARSAFMKALDRDKGIVALHTNLSIVEHMLGNPTRSADLARAACTLFPDSSIAWATRLQNVGDICLDDIPEQLRESADILSAVAVTCLEAGDAVKAVESLDRIPPADMSPHRHLLMANALWATTLKIHGPEGEKRRSRAASELNKAEESISDSDMPIEREIRWMRGVILEHQGEWSRALAAYKWCATRKPLDEDRACRFAAASLQAERELEFALQALDPRPSKYKASVGAFRACLLARLGRPGEAERAFDQAVVDFSQENRDDAEALVAIGFASLELERLDEGVALLAPFADTDIRAAVLIARIETKLGNTENVEFMYRKAIENATQHQGTEIAIEYAEQLRIEGRDSAVVNLLRDFDIQDERVAALAAEAMFNTRDLAGAQELAKLHEDVLHAWPARTMAHVAIHRCDWTGAEHWLRHWWKHQENSPTPCLMLAELLVQLGRDADADETLSKGNFESASLHHKNRLARLLLLVGRKSEALELAYDTLRHAIDNDLTQHNYFVIALEASENRDKQPSRVGIDTSITLKTTQGRQLIYLIVEGTPVRAFGEISQSDPIAKRSVGKKKGDTITLREGASGIEAEITDITSKHGHAMRLALEMQERTNPTNPKMWSISTGSRDDEKFDSTPITKPLEKQHHSSAEVLDLVQSSVLPLAHAEWALDWSTTQLHQVLVNNTSRTIAVEEPDATAAIRVAKRGKFVLTRSALMNIWGFGLTDVFEAMANKVFLHPMLLDDLRSEIREHRRISEEGRRGLVWEDGKAVFHETSREEGKHALSVSLEVVEWLSSTAQEIPLPLDFESHRNGVWKVVSDRAFSAVVVAMSLGLPLLVDDLGLRRAASGLLGVEGCSTYALVAAAMECGKIERTRYTDVVSRMALCGHEALPLPTKALTMALSSSGWPPKVLDRVLNRVRPVGSDLPDLVRSARAAAYIIRLGSLERPHHDVRILAAHVFEALFLDILHMHITAYVENSINASFALLPIQRDIVLEAWRKFSQRQSSGIHILMP